MTYVQQLIDAASQVLGLDSNLIDYDYDVDHEDAIAYCDGDLDEINISINPAYLDSEHLIEIIAHEMIHAHQYLSGKMVNVSHIVTLWKGKEFINSSAFAHISADERHEMYLNQPWERQAYALQVKLATYMKEILCSQQSLESSH